MTIPVLLGSDAEEELARALASVPLWRRRYAVRVLHAETPVRWTTVARFWTRAAAVREVRYRSQHARVLGWPHLRYAVNVHGTDVWVPLEKGERRTGR